MPSVISGIFSNMEEYNDMVAVLREDSTRYQSESEEGAEEGPQVAVDTSTDGFAWVNDVREAFDFRRGYKYGTKLKFRGPDFTVVHKQMHDLAVMHLSCQILFSPRVQLFESPNVLNFVSQR